MPTSSPLLLLTVPLSTLATSTVTSSAVEAWSAADWILRVVLPLLVAGVAFLSVIALLVGTSIAIYQKTFERNTTITIEADRAGLQLAKFGDVRVNGALVGQVRGIEQDGKDARITVALRPEAADDIPENVTVEILPTTLFGQKFISFVMPADPAAASLEEEVLRQRFALAVEDGVAVPAPVVDPR